MEIKKLKFAVVCQHNINRSARVHQMMSICGLNVCSYGTRDHVSLPGQKRNSSIKFEFGTNYSDIYEYLSKLNMEFYKESKVLNMLHENMKVKKHPERFQDSTLEFDVILILDSNSRVDVVKELHRRRNEIKREIMLVYFPIEDELERIRDAARHAAVICQMLEECNGNLENIRLSVERFNDIGENDGYVAMYDIFNHRNLKRKLFNYSSIPEPTKKRRIFLSNIMTSEKYSIL